MFIMANLHPQFAQDSIDKMIALAPAGALRTVKSPIKLIVPIIKHLEVSFCQQSEGIKQFLPIFCILENSGPVGNF